MNLFFFFFSSRRRHTRWNCDWSSDVCSSDLPVSKAFDPLGNGFECTDNLANRKRHARLSALWAQAEGAPDLVDLSEMFDVVSGHRGGVSLHANGSSAWAHPLAEPGVRLEPVQDLDGFAPGRLEDRQQGREIPRARGGLARSRLKDRPVLGQHSAKPGQKGVAVSVREVAHDLGDRPFSRFRWPRPLFEGDILGETPKEAGRG